ncbi:hypothetical protein AVEN_163852-1, partial [Araneus ventricosus]
MIFQANVTLSPTCFLDLSAVINNETCELQTVVIDVPSRTAGELRTEQLKDLELKKIIDCFEDINKSVDFANGTER